MLDGTLNWTTDVVVMDLIAAIAQRAIDTMPEDVGPKCRLVMDIDACHSNGCPLDLVGLLSAKQGDFNHDVSGIVSNINRKTGALEDFFLPRYTSKED